MNPRSFSWLSSPPLVSPIDRPEDPCISVKDPTIVHHGGRWHLFCSIRSQFRTHQIEYLSFTDWGDADNAERHVLTVSDGYFCAPQVFYYGPHKLWYLLYQTHDGENLQPAVSTSSDIADPSAWNSPTLLFDSFPESVRQWIDFWIICDDDKAHLFFTSLNGRLWRSETSRSNFPKGWSNPRLALHAEIFEASHTYRTRSGGYLTLVEAEEQGRRRYTAFESDSLEGVWSPVADDIDSPFAGVTNVTFDGLPWAHNISHGELLRSGSDEFLDVDEDELRFLYQGTTDEDRKDVPYGAIPWRLGLLSPIG